MDKFRLLFEIDTQVSLRFLSCLCFLFVCKKAEVARTELGWWPKFTFFVYFSFSFCFMTIWCLFLLLNIVWCDPHRWWCGWRFFFHVKFSFGYFCESNRFFFLFLSRSSLSVNLMWNCVCFYGSGITKLIHQKESKEGERRELIIFWLNITDNYHHYFFIVLN